MGSAGSVRTTASVPLAPSLSTSWGWTTSCSGRPTRGFPVVRPELRPGGESFRGPQPDRAAGVTAQWHPRPARSFRPGPHVQGVGIGPNCWADRGSGSGRCPNFFSVRWGKRPARGCDQGPSPGLARAQVVLPPAPPEDALVRPICPSRKRPELQVHFSPKSSIRAGVSSACSTRPVGPARKPHVERSLGSTGSKRSAVGVFTAYGPAASPHGCPHWNDTMGNADRPQLWLGPSPYVF